MENDLAITRRDVAKGAAAAAMTLAAATSPIGRGFAAGGDPPTVRSRASSTCSCSPIRSPKARPRIGERQLAFIANVLKETPTDRLVVVLMHIPLRTYLDPDEPAMNTADRAELLGLLGGRPSVSFSGHTHTTEHHYFGAEDENPGSVPHHHHVMTAVSGSGGAAPSTIAASRWPQAATAVPTAFTC
jgi:3',5'-cyclic AMP phosphodiesterase CpdA